MAELVGGDSNDEQVETLAEDFCALGEFHINVSIVTSAESEGPSERYAVKEREPLVCFLDRVLDGTVPTALANMSLGSKVLDMYATFSQQGINEGAALTVTLPLMVDIPNDIGTRVPLYPNELVRDAFRRIALSSQEGMESLDKCGGVPFYGVFRAAIRGDLELLDGAVTCEEAGLIGWDYVLTQPHFLPFTAEVELSEDGAIATRKAEAEDSAQLVTSDSSDLVTVLVAAPVQAATGVHRFEFQGLQKGPKAGWRVGVLGGPVDVSSLCCASTQGWALESSGDATVHGRKLDGWGPPWETTNSEVMLEINEDLGQVKFIVRTKGKPTVVSEAMVLTGATYPVHPFICLGAGESIRLLNPYKRVIEI